MLMFDGVFDYRALQLYLDYILFSRAKAQPSDPCRLSQVHDQIQRETAEQQVLQVFRMKGVFHINGEDKLYILQAVHDTFELTPTSFSSTDSNNDNNDDENDDNNDDTRRRTRSQQIREPPQGQEQSHGRVPTQGLGLQNKVIIIGLGLDSEDFQQGFAKCQAT